jgi:GNAT superfamily N-acetyltransferase
VDDAEAVADVYLRSRHQLVPFAPLAHADEDVREWIRDRLIPSGGVTVGIHGGEVRGMLAVSRRDGFGWIDQLYIDPDRVGIGIGTELLKYAMASLGTPVRLFTFQANERARAFYERRGFRAVRFTDGAGNEERCPDVLYEYP